MKQIFAITDVETTGGTIKQTKITEIAIVLHDGKREIERFSSLINPECPIPIFIQRLTGINDKMVADAPKFYEIAKEIVELYQDTIFVAHNVGFDYKVIRQEFAALGYDFKMHHLCTVRAARKIFPGHASYSLGNICTDMGIEIEARHRALGDAEATALLFQKMFEQDKNQLDTLIKKEVLPSMVHPGLSLNKLDGLPNSTGVYLLKNDHGKTIYIGKSNNIKQRVLQHLKNNSSRRAIQLREAIADVEFILTGSELAALLLESELVKEHQPIYNRQLRKSKFHFGLYAYTDQNGYIRLFSDSISNQNVPPYTTFETKAEANKYLSQQNDFYGLCQKLNGLYPTQNACFAYHTKQCKGACVGKEDASHYNERVNELLKRLSFNCKNAYIIDKGRNPKEVSVFLIENGCFVGFGYMPIFTQRKHPETWREFISVQKENKDARRIVQSYVRNNKSIQLREF
ncbi:MAG: GIY-YIG nuclease family protein [Crocinitomicaceae bacterium]|nr:GIY-YIG nuclease family protein [Crocinitomicaceae bacterium]